MENKLLKDDIAGILFNSEQCREFVLNMVAKIIGSSVEELKNNFVHMSDRINETLDSKYSEVDALYKSDSGYINVEITYRNVGPYDNKQLRYLCHLIIKQVKASENDDKLKKVHQICINNFDYFNKGEFVYKSSIMEEKYHIKRSDIAEIYDINLRTLDYNKVRQMEEDSLEKMLYFFICEDDKKRKKLYEGSEIMSGVVKKTDELMDTVDGLLYFDKEKVDNEISFANGKTEGKNEAQKEMILALKDEISIDKLASSTGLTVEEVQKIIDEKQ